jgi:hypothetical protein
MTIKDIDFNISDEKIKHNPNHNNITNIDTYTYTPNSININCEKEDVQMDKPKVLY